jgi:hypothetical protein
MENEEENIPPWALAGVVTVIVIAWILMIAVVVLAYKHRIG